jgi:hypothetical protein
MEGQGLPDGVQVSAVWVDCAKHQLLLPAAHAVLPSTFERHAFKEGILNTRSTHGLIIPCRASPFVASHASFLKVLGPAPSVKVIATGEAGFAHEAGVWVDKTEEVWFTSNLRKDPTTAEASVNISKLHVPSGQVTEVTIELAKRGNGACPYGDYILFCEQGCGPGLPSSLVAVNPLDPLDAFVVLNNFHGRAFNSLNDAIVLPPPLTRVRNQQPTIRGANVTPNGSSCRLTASSRVSAIPVSSHRKCTFLNLAVARSAWWQMVSSTQMGLPSHRTVQHVTSPTPAISMARAVWIRPFRAPCELRVSSKRSELKSQIRV